MRFPSTTTTASATGALPVPSINVPPSRTSVRVCAAGPELASTRATSIPPINDLMVASLSRSNAFAIVVQILGQQIITLALTPCTPIRPDEHCQAEHGTHGNQGQRRGEASLTQPGEVSCGYAPESGACRKHHSQSRHQIAVTHFRWCCWRKNQLQPIPVPTEEVDVRDQHRTCDDSRPRERRSNRDGNHEDVHDDGQVRAHRASPCEG